MTLSALDFRSQENRKQLISDINTNENKQRKRNSLKETEIYLGDIHQYVFESLESQLDYDTVTEMPIVDSINVARRVVNEQATVYKHPAERLYTELSDEQRKAVEAVYRDMKTDQKLCKSNKYFKLQGQNLIQVVPRNGMLTIRVYKQHQYDAIPNPVNPEEAFGYVISSFDKSNLRDSNKDDVATGNLRTSRTDITTRPDGKNEVTADPDDYLSTLSVYVVWTLPFTTGDELVPGLNFLMDSKGNIIDKDEDKIENPLVDVLPFVDVSFDKDFEYYTGDNNNLTNFTASYNALWTHNLHVSNMQGWSQAVITGPSDMHANNMRIGINKLIHLVTKNDGIESKFEFISPSPDLPGTLQVTNELMGNFLSGLGVDPSAISGKTDAQQFNSGFQMLLAAINKMDATREDYDTYGNVEQELYDIVIRYMNVLNEAKKLKPKYDTANINEEETEVIVVHATPEAATTDLEEMDLAEREIESGLESKITVTMKRKNMIREEAVDYLKQVEEDEGLSSQSEISNEALMSGEIGDTGPTGVKVLT